MNYKMYQTERLILRPTDQSDASFIYELMNSEKWIKYIGERNIKSLDDAKTYIKEKMDPQLERLGFGNYTMILKSDESIKVGTCGLYDREGLEGLDIGFALLESFENLGYAYEAARKVLELGLQDFGYSKISAITTRDNVSSQKLIKKLGLRFIKMINLPNDEEELMLFEIQNA